MVGTMELLSTQELGKKMLRLQVLGGPSSKTTHLEPGTGPPTPTYVLT